MEGIGPYAQASAPRPDHATERTVAVIGTALRQARAQASALLSLVEQVPVPADGKGQHVNYRA